MFNKEEMKKLKDILGTASIKRVSPENYRQLCRRLFIIVEMKEEEKECEKMLGDTMRDFAYLRPVNSEGD